MITAAQVKELREKTGAGMMDCKKVLTETDGDMEKAIELLRERGIAKAAKKSGRVAAEGLVECYVSEDGKVGAIVEVNAETDFVAKNQEFRDFVMDVAKQVVEKNPANVEELLAQESISEAGKTVQEVLTNKIATIGENMNIRRFERFETTGIVEKYIHGDGKIAVLVNMSKGTKEVAKDVSMQAAAMKPLYLNISDVPADVLDNEKNVLKEQAMNEGKPAEIAEKMVQGRIQKFYKEICLAEQSFIKDSDVSVSKYVANNGGEILKMVRYEVGEGMEKRNDNFAEEVMNQVKGN